MTDEAERSGGTQHAAITFDLDGLARDPFDRAPSANELDRLHHLAFAVVLPRIMGWLDAAGVKATFFAIGADVERFPDAIAALARRGHEVASHSYDHPRDFSRLDAAAVRSELQRAGNAIAAATGSAPCGFRAPGYTISPGAIGVLTELGYSYDASVVPSWSYSMLKSAFRLFGRPEFRNYLVPQEIACARAPRLPYRIAATDLFAASRDNRLIEIPLTTLGPMQFPFIHGLVQALPSPGRSLIQRLVRRRPFFSLAFHDLEFAARGDYGPLPASGMTERHLRVPIDLRLAELSALLSRIKETHTFVTLREVAAMTLAGTGTAV